MNTVVIHPPAKEQEQNHPQATSPLGDRCFIETQFPVSKMSIETYAERRSNQSQTITGLGKWWGRKPLVLCRATILGLLLPATNNPQKDRDIFLRLMTMDDDGLLRRKSVNISATELFKRLPPVDKTRYFEPYSTEEKARLKRGLSHQKKEELQTRVFLGLCYDERIEYCDRPEQIDGPSPESWQVINDHLGTNISSLQELVVELGKRRFGHVPRVGDSFCGGGSIPFEAARLGCDAYGSDLNPVAALLTWASLNIVGGNRMVVDEVRKVQREVYDAVDRQITEWGIEHRESDPETGRRWRADAYLYCTETICPECGWRVPMAPSWLVGPTSKVVAVLCPDSRNKRFDIEIRSDASADDMRKAADAGTTSESELICPNRNCKAHTPIKAIRGDGRGTFGESKSCLRGWTNGDLLPRENDIFGERLYCVRWVDSWTDLDNEGNERVRSERYYRTPTIADFEREQKGIELLTERFDLWQEKGYIPSRKIEPGDKTSEPVRTRGWTHWHHLFTPRQLLVNGLFLERADALRGSTSVKVAALLGVGRCADWNSRLCRWGTGAARESIAQTFSNQALNPLSNYASKAVSLLQGSWFPISPVATVSGASKIEVQDARRVGQPCDLWITDPPYADAVNYHELSEFFLAWYAGGIQRLFQNWIPDSRRALAVQGSGESFRDSMVAAYHRLASSMPDNGLQVVMFTHQDPAVWADLSLILWGAGLRVTTAWCIQTEREASGTRDGNYVQGTVLLVLRKQVNEETAFLDEVYQEVETEVRHQLDTMRDLDDAKDPNFTDTDYQLAAYAAALRVLTAKKIQEIDVAYELTRTRKKGEKSPVEELIERAVKIACDHLVPIGIDTHLWKSFSALERLYLKGLELESHGEHRTGVYQELARGFGVEEYKQLLASNKANETRLKTATEFARKELGNSGFGPSLVRHALFAAFKTAESESPRDGITWLTTEVKDYASSRQRVIEILEFLAARRQNASLPHWHKDAEAAGLLAGALRNRQDNV
jgi:adenine-specific DNA methylase